MYFFFLACNLLINDTNLKIITKYNLHNKMSGYKWKVTIREIQNYAFKENQTKYTLNILQTIILIFIHNDGDDFLII